MKDRVYNFSSGPAALPAEVLKKVKEELCNYQGLGYSILEESHRSNTFKKILEESKKKILKILGLGENYKPLFLHGGATSEFFRIAYNLLSEKGQKADYIETDTWVKKAMVEASNFSDPIVIASSKDKNFNYIPQAAPGETLNFSPEARFVYLCSNNTVVGTQYQEYPIPKYDNFLVGDFTSDILSRKCNLENFGIIFAGSQKNLAPAGLSTVLIREDVFKKCNPNFKGINSYLTAYKENSLYNTSPVFPIYFMHYVLDWVEEQGGLEVIEKNNRVKAELLYETIDNFDDYTPTANKNDRSIMNIPFTLKDDETTKIFLEKAKENGLVNLKGHRSVGGIRASIYNALPLAGVEKLCDFMRKFNKKN